MWVQTTSAANAILRETITVIEKEKDFYVLFNKNLKFSNHIDNIDLKADSILGLIKGTFKNWTEEGFATMYRTCVCPHLEYTVQIWPPQLRR